MQLTRYTDYGLRTLIYLALLPAGQKASIDEISLTYDISRNNVNKIVHQLGKAEIIQTQRGKGGGISLAKPAEKLNLADLVLLLENSMQVVECVTPLCRIQPACKLKGIMAEATQAFVNTLNNYHLSDLVAKEESKLVAILEIDRTTTL
ncbi:Rrf2 family transcriptional regulator [Paraglaciecola sp.]|uniref:Rrf2 family transcriptional regulator n=1 Tax=Paraglaciecola sp. TaxID=1920173 RepID=UPI003EF5294C